MAAYDFVVVGGGSAGCVVAGRMAESGGRVLLLEAGGSDRTVFCTKPGMISIVHTVPQVKKRFDWGYYTVPQSGALGRKMPYVRGKVLGGSSAINGMIFVRGHRANYDGWEAEGCEGWGYEGVLPYFKRLENFEGGEDAWRGVGGPVEVTRQSEISPVSEAFQEAVCGVCEVERNADYNGAEQRGAGVFQMSAKGGRRFSTSEAYVHRGGGGGGGLEVVLGAQVLRVVIEGGRARGVEYVVEGGGGGVERAELEPGGEVILSGGVIGSAQILMLSGVGPAEELSGQGIGVVEDLPVGENLHDHLFFPLVFLAPEGGHRGTALHFLGGMMREFLGGGGTWFGKTVFESVAFVDSGMDHGGGGVPDLQIHTLPWAYPAPNQDAPGRPEVDKRPALTVQPTLIYPKSRGRLRLKSSDPRQAPLIDPGFLREGADVDFFVRSIELCREIMNGGVMKKFVTGELEPGSKFGGEEELRREIPNRVSTVYHPVGTCRMGVDERAVVDPKLRVRGVEGLRVADASIMPEVIGGNTNAPCIMIGEKCADLLKEGR